MPTLWSNDDGQDIAEYAVMLAVILVLVIGTLRLIGGMQTMPIRRSSSERDVRDEHSEPGCWLNGDILIVDVAVIAKNHSLYSLT